MLEVTSRFPRGRRGLGPTNQETWNIWNPVDVFEIEYESYILWPRSLVLKMACSASFFSRNSVFLSQQFSRNSIFQPVSAKFQTSERGRCLPSKVQCRLQSGNFSFDSFYNLKIINMERNGYCPCHGLFYIFL